MSGLRVALGQFAVAPDWPANLEIATDLARRAAAAGADLLVLPEGVLSRTGGRPPEAMSVAQRLDGPFVTGLQAAVVGSDLTVIAGIYELLDPDRAANTLVVVRGGELVGAYRKLHLYDAFGDLESDDITPGHDGVVTVSVGDVAVGLMTCYDVRFPEVARLLADRGAELIVLPAAWARGPLKEHHWEVMVTARALENTCYVAAAGECGGSNIGGSMVVNPLGVVVSRTGADPALVVTDIDLDQVRAARRILPVLANRRFRVDPTVLALPEPSRAAVTADRFIPQPS